MIPKHLLIAVGELGEKEISGSETNPRIAEYLASVGLPGSDEIAWCAAFVNWVLRRAGIFGTGKGLAKSYLRWGIECGCEPGAIAIMNRGANPINGHVAFVLQNNGDTAYLIGGNQSNAVTISCVQRKTIVSYRKAA